MLTPHELTLVLSINRLKLTEGMNPRLANSHTVQAILAELSQKELDAVKAAHTFMELMDLVAQQKMLRRGNQPFQ